MFAQSASEVLRKIGNSKLSLQKIVGHGYWIFVYDDNGPKYETESVYTPRLNDMTYEQWVDIGRRFAATCEAAQ